MLNIFQIASQDQSIIYLSHIFGSVGGAIPLSASSTTGAPLAGVAVTTYGSATIMAVMFKVINTIALTVGAIVITYVTFVGLMYTASEGSFLGQKWNKVWVPLRLVIGTISLFPAASGYSLLQVIIMWIIVQGIGAADTLWSSVLTYAQRASIYGDVRPTEMTTSETLSVPDTLQTVFQGLTCQAEMRRSDPSVGRINYYCASSANQTSAFCSSSYDLYNVVDGPQTKDQAATKNGIVYSFGPGGVCGKLTYCNSDPNLQDSTCAAPKMPDNFTSCNDSKFANNPYCTKASGPDSLACMTCKGQQDALQSIIPVLGGVAEGLAEIDHEYIVFHETPQSSQSTQKPPQWILDYCNEKGISQQNCCLESTDPSVQCTGFDDYGIGGATNVDDNTAQYLYAAFGMKEFLGSSLDFMNAATNQYIQQSVTGPMVTYIANSADQPLSKNYEEMRKTGWILAGAYYFKLAKKDQKNMKAAVPSPFVFAAVTTFPNYRINYKAADTIVNYIESTTLPATGAGPLSPAQKHITKGMGLMTSGFMKMLTNMRTDPIASLAQFGYGMLVMVQVLFVSITFAMGYAAAAGKFNPFALGTGITENPVGAFVSAVLSAIEPVFIGLLVALFTIGALLGIYVPLIPYLLFAMTAIGWMIATVEAMVSAPIVALGILGPGGQHEVLGRAEPGMMIMLNLFLRPTLAVFGLVAAMLLSAEAVRMVNLGFSTLVNDMYVYGPVEFLIFMMAYTTFIVTVLSKTYSLIHIIPERILTYIGGHPVGYGEGEALSAVKGGVESSAGGIAGAGKATGKAVGQAGGAHKAEKDFDEKKKAGALSAGQPGGSTQPGGSAQSGTPGSGGGNQE